MGGTWSWESEIPGYGRSETRPTGKRRAELWVPAMGRIVAPESGRRTVGWRGPGAVARSAVHLPWGYDLVARWATWRRGGAWVWGGGHGGRSEMGGRAEGAMSESPYVVFYKVMLGRWLFGGGCRM